MKTLFRILFFALIASALQAADTQPAKVEKPADNTVITSDELELVGGDAANTFYFTGNVKITGTNLVATCDKMEVLSTRSGPTEKTVGEMGAIQNILMIGNVVIEQAGRVATAGKAEILPNEDKVVLTENPKVEDSQGTVTGWKMELLKGERKVKVYGDPSSASGGRSRVTLPGFKDLGFDDKSKDRSPDTEDEKKETSQWKTPNP
ncbi:LptA/OstA family protein [Cerasicoccus arenae]|uniref:Organic solvent tolerance-like N-terminal domain-containing protein n=1 Tax=Cerasicoccus arenae TaxID=424488 RepID=A0A8J3DI95_9BACT|nr:LptA/OstA family protein [Cerasicoccus arenae]MBK1858422.1 hypothetical protein [Cerasicoccus arenae]GHC02459.1 hypothetical protein GCM10007047_18780 [Cerasicoccus arenae]